MNNSKKDQDLESNSSVKPPAQKCQAGTLFHYFQKKVDPAKPPPPPKEKTDKVIQDNLVSAAGGSKDQKNGTNASPKQSKDSQHASHGPSQCETTQDQDASHSQKCKHSLSEKKEEKEDNLTGKPNCIHGASKEANQDFNVNKVKGSCETKSNLSHSTKQPSQNPFQILMESGKKKGVWDKPTTKAKEAEDRSSEEECLEVESEVPVRSTVQPGNAKHFSIFSKKTNKSAANMTQSNGITAKAPDTLSSGGIKAETSTKDGKLETLAKQSESQSSAARKSKPAKGLHRSSLDASKSSKRKKSSAGIAEEDTKETKSKKTKDCKSSDGKKAECSSIVRKINRSKSGDENAMETDTASTPRKSRLKVISDSDFEPDNVQSGKRKDRTPSKSQNSTSKRPRTGSLARGDTDASSKPATLSAAQKLVKKSRNQNQRRSSDGARRDSVPSDKSIPKQTLLTAGRKDSNAEPLAADAQSDTGSPRRRSARAGSKPKRRRPPSDSELEFTPGRKTKSRPKETEGAGAEHTPGTKSKRKRSRVRQAAEASGSELEVTHVKKPSKRASASGRRRHSSGPDIEVLSTKKKKSGRRSPDVVEISQEKRPAERRSSRPRRPMILSDSEAEPSPVKRSARRSRAARSSVRPATPTDSEVETTPVKKPPRRSSRPSRPVRRLSDSEVEPSPLKKRAPRGAGRRSAAAAEEDEPEVVLVRSRSAGAAGVKSGRSGVNAFQMLRGGGRPPKQTAAEKAAGEARRAFLSSGVPESLQVQAEVARRLEESLTPLFPEVSHVHQRDSEAAPLPEVCPLPAGLSWRAEPPPLSPTCPTTVRGLVPALASRPGKAAESADRQLVDVVAGGDVSGELPSSTGDAGVSPVKPTASSAEATDASEPAASTATAAASPPRLPCLSLPDCAASLRRLLSADRDFSSASSTTSAPGPALWTDRFRPRHHEAFVGASLPAAELQEWLADWSAPSTGRGWDEDGSEEAAGDGTVLLLGPTGCGKTSAVYAAAAQLGFQVLEVSASSRRAGRHLSLQLSEATQSQRVNMPGGGASAAEPPSRSLLLLEDVQLASEELDDGFLAAAASLAATAKRPVVLTSGDPAVTRTRLLRALPHRLLAAAAPPAAALRSRLALVALTQGWLLPETAAAQLADGGDVRRALLQLQWLCEGEGVREGAEKADTKRALTEAQLETAEEFVDQLPVELKVVRLRGEPEPVEVPELQTESVGRRESGWEPPRPVRESGYDGQTRRRWRCVDPDLFSDEDDARPALSPTPAPATEPAPGGAASEPERSPPEERALLSASVAALAGLYDLRSACDALVAPTERQVMGSWWQPRPEADMTETEQPRCVTEERGEQLGRQLAEEALGAAGRRCAGQLRAARSVFSASGRPEPAGLRLPVYDEEGVREAAWEENGRLAPTTPSLLLSRRAVTADLLPSIRRICRLECGRRATDGGRTRRFLHYFDQMGLHAVPSGLRTHICKSLM